MSEHTVDPRILRTRKMLKDALSQLIEEKGFDAITVKDLTSKAGLNRGTFYLNYTDKYDLLEKCEEEAISELRKFIRVVNPLDIIQYVNRNEAYPPLVKVFEYLYEHSVFFRAVLGPKGDPAFQKKLKKFMEVNFYEKLVKMQLQDKESSVPYDYVIAYITSAHLGIILYWFESGMKYTPNELAMMLVNLSYNGPTGLLFQLKKIDHL
ncbi:TetR/AcrR family transcriptional regulator [Brevibacillus dissolubilis]|uniref:TetR/AcrR family transcriptional regulator n=1 Tax=Brevibacillus dissolubilis TaxID=1844116 RepID=UPI00159BC696|nr:TetR/AcrR family transcriptional regulator [Brevibacillus dissolubilis]